jgi:hypothetical protein
MAKLHPAHVGLAGSSAQIAVVPEALARGSNERESRSDDRREMDVGKPGSHSLLRLARNSNGGGQ